MNTNTQQPALAAGDLDPDFGENGVIFTSFGPETINATALGVNIAPDGKLLISGYRGQNDYALARLNPDGTPDQSFGNAGFIVGQFKPGLESAIAATFVTSDQKLVLVGKVYITDAGDTDYRALTRLNRDGSLDTSFGDQGSVILDLPLGKAASVSNRFARDPETLLDSSSQVNAVLQADGKIVVNDTFKNIAVTFRLTPDGALDTSFNGTGYVTQSFPDARTWLGPLYVENDKIITAGTYVSQATGNRPLVIRYNADGSLDSSFGENGIFIAPPESTDSHSSQLLDAFRETNGNILGIGSTSVYPLKALIMSFDKDGSIDPAFNGGKALLSEISPEGCQWNNSILDSSSGLNVVCGNTLGSELEVIVGRIDNQGVWDTDFGGSQGWVKVVPGVGYTLNYDVTVQNDSNILVVGSFFQSTGFLKGFVLRILG
ncbi:hypothetical protein K5D69_07160 [Pseudomonas cichorii]|uniref:delta-60 repeat domain-containing protein n=1 Tax=Pseudomonas cichorii TaxID=36746 RepID=UPI001C8AD2E3|nr:delta-60 repeat domain-containing protein [Pseudomonas cichorii]MBX8514475.1 hypothetical protein [Pseudomonas cichorii]